MSLNPQSFEQAKLVFKPLKRSGFKKKTDTSSQRLKTPLRAKGKPKRARKKLIKLPKLHKRVWREFSIYIRSSAADESGVVQCVTCPNRFVWNSGQIQAGHWMHGRLDFDERNVHPQCVTCNYHWNTKVSVAYAIFMSKTYGVEVMEELQLLANTHGNRYSRDELNELLATYRTLNAESAIETC